MARWGILHIQLLESFTRHASRANKESANALKEQYCCQNNGVRTYNIISGVVQCQNGGKNLALRSNNTNLNARRLFSSGSLDSIDDVHVT